VFAARPPVTERALVRRLIVSPVRIPSWKHSGSSHVASVLQAWRFRGDVTVFRLNAADVGESGLEPASRRNTAERVCTTEATQNPEVAGSNPAPATEKRPWKQGLLSAGVRKATATSASVSASTATVNPAPTSFSTLFRARRPAVCHAEGRGFESHHPLSLPPSLLFPSSEFRFGGALN
jgi:hypothetical protein